ncbi:uncharacterized protein LOC144374776 [Ictidomys tridecemlineatus]
MIPRLSVTSCAWLAGLEQNLRSWIEPELPGPKGGKCCKMGDLCAASCQELQIWTEQCLQGTQDVTDPVLKMEMEEGRIKKIENEIGDHGNETFVEELSSGPQEENYISPGENSLKFPAGKLQDSIQRMRASGSTSAARGHRQRALEVPPEGGGPSREEEAEPQGTAWSGDSGNVSQSHSSASGPWEDESPEDGAPGRDLPLLRLTAAGYATCLLPGAGTRPEVEAFVRMIGSSVARMEQVTRAEAELEAFPWAFQKLLHTISVPSFFTKPAPARPPSAA